MEHSIPPGFDPDFDDTRWTEAWRYVPISQVPPGVHASGYRVERQYMQQVDVFGRPYWLPAPFDCRLLYDPDDRLWMSTTPQEHIMMVNNARRAQGHVLVGGLGLGLFPQYAETGAVGAATRFTVIEYSPVICDMVAPTLTAALTVPASVEVGDVVQMLSGPARDLYDTIFLDTWDTLDAAYLPEINRVRDLAALHLAPGGCILLWGYGWMVRLFTDACRQLLSVPPAHRRDWLETQRAGSPRGVALLWPVMEQFEDVTAEGSKALEAALLWCRRFIVAQTTG